MYNVDAGIVVHERDQNPRISAKILDHETQPQAAPGEKGNKGTVTVHYGFAAGKEHIVFALSQAGGDCLYLIVTASRPELSDHLTST